MTALQRLRDDLVERRLWPVVLLLVLALVAVFVVVRKQEGDAPTPVAADAAGLTATELAEAQRALHEVTAELGVVAPVQASRGTRRDPFALPGGSTPADARTPAGRSPRRDASPDAGGGSAAVAPSSSSPPSSSSSSSSTPSSSSSSSSSSGPASRPPSAPRALPAPAPAPKPEPRPAEPTTYTLLRTDVRFDGEPLQDVVRLRPLPTAKAPVVLFLGPTAGGRGAAFVVSGGAQVDGEGRCRPRARLCTHLVLRPGEQATLTVGEERHTVRLLRVRSEQTTSRARAERHYARQSERGRCVLDVLDFLAYDDESGTVAPHHDHRGCEYELGDDGTVGAR